MLGLVLLSLLLTSSLGHAHRSSLSGGDASSPRRIAWSNAPNQYAQKVFRLNVKVNGVEISSVTVDTGSTGFLLSASRLGYANDSELKKCCKPAFEFLSSSHRYYEGFWLPSNLTFTSQAGSEIYSSIPVFAVTETGNCSSYQNAHCVKGHVERMPSRVQYMGVGFGRWSDEQPDATADKNPLLNVDFGNDEMLRSGYTISGQGLIVGVCENDLADGWNLTRLAQITSPDAPEDRPEWRGTPMCVEVAGSECFVGTALFDTGIDYSYLGVPSEATENVKIEWKPNSWILKNGTEVTVRIGMPPDFIGSYTFQVGEEDRKWPMTPARVQLTHEHSDGAFINTGRFFYNGFDLLFDELSGMVGLRIKAEMGRVSTRLREKVLKSNVYTADEL